MSRYLNTARSLAEQIDEVLAREDLSHRNRKESA